MHRSRLSMAAGMLGMGVLLAACTGIEPSPLAPPPGSNEAYRDGYTDGCWDGYRDAGRDPIPPYAREDTARFAKDADYRAGFKQAYQACFEDEKRHPHIHPDGGAHI